MAQIKTFLKSGAMHRTPLSYRSRTTALHRCPAGIKLIFLIVVSAAPFFGTLYSAAAAVFVIFCAVISGIAIRDLFSGSLPLILMLLVFTVFRALDSGCGISFTRLKSGLQITINILVCFLAASLFFAVTTITEIRKVLSAPELLLFRRQSRLGLSLALMLGFLPRFFECWENSNLAARARGSKPGYKRIKLILPLVAGRMIEAAVDTARALTSRGLE